MFVVPLPLAYFIYIGCRSMMQLLFQYHYEQFWLNSFLLHSISGPLYIRECCWGQECCKKGIAADAWITANWYPCCWNHHSSNSPEGNPPYQTCNVSSSWTQWTGLIFFLLRNCKLCFINSFTLCSDFSELMCVFLYRWFCWVLHQILAYKVTLQIWPVSCMVNIMVGWSYV